MVPGENEAVDNRGTTPASGSRRDGAEGSLENRLAFEQTLTDLHAATRELLRTRSPTAVSRILVETARDVLGFPLNVVYVRGDTRDELREEIRLVEEGQASEPAGPDGRPPDAVEQAFLSGDVATIGPETLEGLGEVREGLESGLALPMDDYGVLVVASPGPEGLQGNQRKLVGMLATHGEAAFDHVSYETQLQQEVQRFRSLVQEVDEYAIFMLDADGLVQSWNRGAERIKGYRAEEILGEPFSRFYTAEEREAGVPWENLAKAAERGSVEDEGWRVRADGSRFWANVTITALHDEEGRIQGFAKVTRDMTDRREREEQVRQERERFRSLVRGVEDYAIFMLDPEGRVQSWNQGARKLKGYEREEILGDHFSRFYTEEDQEAGRPESNLEAAVENGSTEDEGWRVRADGSRFWANVTITTLRDEEGGIRGFAKVTRDMTERRRWERELEESRRTIVDNFPNGSVALVDEELRYKMIGGVPPLGIEEPLEELRGRRAPEVLPPALRDELVPSYRQAFQGEADAFEQESEGHVYRFRIVPVRNEEDEVIAVLEMSQDVTGEKQRERKLEESNARLEQFAYAASHDLQEPLRMVSSYLQLIERRYGEDLDEEGREFFAYAVDGAKRMREMIKSLLEFSRVTMTDRPLEPTDAGAVLEEVLADLSVRIQDSEAEITANGLPTVRADDTQLAQVFRNLISNALKYSGEEPPRIHVDAQRRGDMWRFKVQDEGVGIAPEHTDQIFEVFKRLEGHDGQGGTGIGLALCEQIVDRHGGQIWVDSEPGEGSAFTFTIPALRSEIRPPVHPAEPAWS